MRIWDIHQKHLRRQHLLGEHRKLHAIWSILTKNKKGYMSHPETKRWHGKLKALCNKHELLVEEMIQRGYHHRSPLDKRLARGKTIQNYLIDNSKYHKKMLQK